MGCDGGCVFLFCIVRRGAVGARVWGVWSVCVLYASCDSFSMLRFCMTCSFVNAGRGCNRRPPQKRYTPAPVS